MSGDRAYLSGRRTSDRPTADGASLAALGGRVRGQHRAPAAAARGGAAGHAAATAGSAQGRRQTGLGAGGVRIPALTYLSVFGADIDDFGVCVPGDPGGLRVIVRASAFCNPALVGAWRRARRMQKLGWPSRVHPPDERYDKKSRTSKLTRAETAMLRDDRGMEAVGRTHPVTCSVTGSKCVRSIP